MSSLPGQIIHFVLTPALQKRLFSEPTLPFQRYFGCYEQVFETGAVLGHTFHKNFVWFIQFFSQPGKSESLAKGLNEMARDHLKVVGSASTFFDLAMYYEESNIRETWKKAGKTEAEIENRLNHHGMTQQEAMKELNLGLNLGLAIGGTFPDLVERFWRDAYERPFDAVQIELLRRTGVLSPGSTPEIIPLRRQKEYLLSGVRSFVKANRPELTGQLQAIITSNEDRTPPVVETDISTTPSTTLRKQLNSAPLDSALKRLVDVCKRPDPNTLFITDHWIEPRLEKLRMYLSDPITTDQAEALCDAINKRVSLDIVIDWSMKRNLPWSTFLQQIKESEAATRESEAATERMNEVARQRRTEEGRRRQAANLGTFKGGLIAGVPICRIPEHVRQFPNFLTWWKEVGRLNPQDHKGWSSISGPGVMRGRSEIIDPHAWETLPLAEQEAIREWAQSIPVGIFYD